MVLLLDFVSEIKKEHCGNIQWLMTFKVLNVTNMSLFSLMSSSDAMFEASSVYFQYVNGRAAHVKIDRISSRCGPGQ